MKPVAGLIEAVETKQAPFISPQSVQTALDTLLYSATPTPGQPLIGLSLVDEQVADPDAPRTSHLRQFALHTVLIDLIRRAYMAQRAVFGLAPVPEMASVSEVRAALGQDAQSASYELLAWSVLYARYVRVDAALQQTELADALRSNVRSIRRYQQHGVRRLTEALTAAEWEARRRQRRRRLAVALPVSEPPRLIGREPDLAALHDVFNDEQRHVVISGPSGIGKTTLVLAAVHELISLDQLEAIAWVSNPSSVEFVYSQVATMLLPQDARMDVREFLTLRPTAIVLDGIESLWASSDALDDLLRTWAAALVLMTSTSYQPLREPHALLRLTPLSHEAALALVGQVSTSVQDSDEVAAVGEAVWDTVGGHPLALTLLTRRIELLPTLDRVEIMQTIDPLFRSAYDRLGVTERRALYALSAMPEGEVDAAAVLSLWQGSFGPVDLSSLVRQSWLVRRSVEAGLVELPQAARQYLQARLGHDSAARAAVVALLETLDRALRTGNQAASKAAEQVLWQSHFPISSALRRSWLNLLWRQGIRDEALPRWRVLLEQTLTESTSDSADLKLIYGVCLRRLLNWDPAAAALAGAITDAGRVGDFLTQTEALVELAVLERYQGAYESALARLAQAEKAARRLNASALLESIMLEQAQIAIESGNLGRADALLEPLADSLRVLALKAESYALQGHLAEAERTINAAYDVLPPGDYSVEARLRTVLGRAQQQAGSLMQAHDHFLAALTRLEQGNDLFALNRARVNLAAVLIGLDDLDSAVRLLRAAEAEQIILGDSVGLAATRHNAQIVRVRLVRGPR
jgi:tetratricopeptide (TPR) repeat protein